MMARPLKSGADYFPLDTDFFYDPKIKLIRAEFGAKGIYILLYLLCEIYRNDGYYLNWNRDSCYLVSEGAGCVCSPKFINEVVTGCTRRLIFDAVVREKCSVLTSRSIQKRYVRIMERRTRIDMKKDYFLLDVNNRDDIPETILPNLWLDGINVYNNLVSVGQKPDYCPTETPQSKIKENKLNYNIYNVRTHASEKNSGNYGSFDTEDFFNAAVKKSLGGE